MTYHAHTYLTETHVFGVNESVDVVVSICHLYDQGADLVSEKETLLARIAPISCRLRVVDGHLFLVRDGESMLVSDKRQSKVTAHIEVTPEVVRERLRAAGLPLSPTDPDMASKALAGLLDGSMVVSRDELEHVAFDYDALTSPAFCRELERSDHLASGVHQYPHGRKI
ncbi:hypothetical protein RYA05_03010 [Pseudomonas syringae pv. actinidiae]|nr:hypothetical protein [Pseudomonas syringae pv. actinidiae]